MYVRNLFPVMLIESRNVTIFSAVPLHLSDLVTTATADRRKWSRRGGGTIAITLSPTDV